jgi:hypothetical protein
LKTLDDIINRLATQIDTNIAATLSGTEGEARLGSFMGKDSKHEPMIIDTFLPKSEEKEIPS